MLVLALLTLPYVILLMLVLVLVVLMQLLLWEERLLPLSQRVRGPDPLPLSRVGPMGVWVPQVVAGRQGPCRLRVGVPALRLRLRPRLPEGDRGTGAHHWAAVLDRVPATALGSGQGQAQG